MQRCTATAVRTGLLQQQHWQKVLHLAAPIPSAFPVRPAPSLPRPPGFAVPSARLCAAPKPAVPPALAPPLYRPYTYYKAS